MKKTYLAALLCCSNSLLFAADADINPALLQAKALADAQAKAKALQSEAGTAISDLPITADTQYAKMAQDIAAKSQSLVGQASGSQPVAIPATPEDIANGEKARSMREQAQNSSTYQALKQSSDRLEKQTSSVAQDVAQQSLDLARSEENLKQVGKIYKDVSADDLGATLGDKSKSAQAKDTAPLHGILFLSMSMPEKDISAALQMASENKVRVYFIGLLRGSKNIPQAMRVLRKITAAAGIKEAEEPDVGIDPGAFGRYGVTVVPTLIRETGEGHFHRAEGTINWTYFEQAVKGEPAGEWLNVRAGNVWKIEETSLIDEMKRRMAAIDWEAKKKEAVNRFWSHQKMNDLPPATKSERWMIDPTVRVTKDMYDRGGKMIAAAGTVINPLAHAYTPIRMLVINPVSQQEIDWAKGYQKEHPFNGQTMVLGTDFTAKGWDVMQHASNELQARIRLAPTELITRFRLSATPAVVETIGQAFGVQQFAIQKEAAE